MSWCSRSCSDDNPDTDLKDLNDVFLGGSEDESYSLS